MSRISEVFCFAKLLSVCFKGAPDGTVVKKKKNPLAKVGLADRTCRFYPWVTKIASSRKREATPVFLPAKFHGQRRLVSCSPWDRRVRHNWACMQIGKGLCMSTPPPQQPFIKLSNTNDHHTGCLCNVKFLYVHFSLWSHTCKLSKKEKVKFGTGSLVSHLQRRLTVAQMFSQITVNVPTTDDTPVTRSYTLFCCLIVLILSLEHSLDRKGKVFLKNQDN